MSLFWIFSRQNFVQQAAYRVNFWLGMAGLLLELYVVYILWHVLYEQTPASFGNVSLQQMITYAILGILLGAVLSIYEGVHSYVQRQIRMGMITSDLMKPVDFMFHMMARDFGRLASTVLFMWVPPLVLAYLLFDLLLPSDPLQIAGFVIALVQAWVILFFCNFLFGLISFKTLDLLGFTFTYYALVRFSSGQIIPLWMYPDVLQPLLNALPFKSIFYTPIATFSGILHGEALVQALWVQTAWIAGLFLISRLIWGRIHRHLIVQGG